MFPIELLDGTVMQDHFVCLKRDELLKSLYNEVQKTDDVDITLGEM